MSAIKTRALTMCAICIALAIILQQIPAFRMPQGGSLTLCSMLFIVLAAYWFGPAMGVLSGIVLGLLDLLLGGYVFHPAQVLLDYPLAFGALGIAGFFRTFKFGLHIGYAAGVAGRYLMHVMSGWIFFSEFAPAGQHPLLYSAVYNISYIWPEAVLTLIILSIPAFRQVVDRVGERVAA